MSLVMRLTERYLNGCVSRVINGGDAGGYESVAQLRLLARSRGWAQVTDIRGGVQHLTYGILSDSSWGPMLVDVALVEPHFCTRDNQGLCHDCGAEVPS